MDEYHLPEPFCVCGVQQNLGIFFRRHRLNENFLMDQCLDLMEKRFSPGLQKENAWPLRVPRPVRPTRCT